MKTRKIKQDFLFFEFCFLLSLANGLIDSWYEQQNTLKMQNTFTSILFSIDTFINLFSLFFLFPLLLPCTSTVYMCLYLCVFLYPCRYVILVRKLEQININVLLFPMKYIFGWKTRYLHKIIVLYTFVHKYIHILMW